MCWRRLPPVVRARTFFARWWRRKSYSLKTIAFLGRDGGQCAGLADVELLVSGTLTARIQEGHKFLLHTICELVEEQLPPTLDRRGPFPSETGLPEASCRSAKLHRHFLRKIAASQRLPWDIQVRRADCQTSAHPEAAAEILGTLGMAKREARHSPDGERYAGLRNSPELAGLRSPDCIMG